MIMQSYNTFYAGIALALLSGSAAILVGIVLYVSKHSVFDLDGGVLKFIAMFFTTGIVLMIIGAAPAQAMRDESK